MLISNCSAMLKRFSFLLLIFLCYGLSVSQEVYELRTYHVEVFKPTDILHDYFENALIPALNRQGVQHVGVFEDASMALPPKMYVLITHPSITSFQNSGSKLLNDEQYQGKARTYLNYDPDEMTYESITVNLISPAAGFPKLIKPSDDSELFELRIYTSYNEDALRRKVKMFNDHEFDIFEEVDLPMVFFGSNIAGDNMPCLTYMLAFRDMDHHKESWEKFLQHPEWKRIVALEEYADAMNDIIRVFMKPVSYSQL